MGGHWEACSSSSRSRDTYWRPKSGDVHWRGGGEGLPYRQKQQQRWHGGESAIPSAQGRQAVACRGLLMEVTECEGCCTRPSRVDRRSAVAGELIVDDSSLVSLTLMTHHNVWLP